MSSLLLDIGGTFIKSCVSDESSIRPKSFRRHKMPELGGKSPLNLEIPKSPLLKLINREIEFQIFQNTDIKRIFLSGQMGCWTIEGLESLKDVIVSWQDQRILASYTNLEEALFKNGFQNLYRANGCEIGEGVPAMGLLSVQNEVLESTNPKLLLTLMGWCIRQITDSENTPLHITDAASTGLLDLDKGDWLSTFYNSFSSRLTFPGVLSAVESVGKLKNTSIDVYCGVGDQQASLLGVGLSENNIVLNIGTGGQVAVMESLRPRPRTKTRPYFNNTRIYTRTHLLSGRFLNKIIEIVRNDYKLNFNYSDFDQINPNNSCYEKLFPADLAMNPQYLREVASKMSSTSFLEISIATMAKQYFDAISDLGGLNDRYLIFAGGVGQKNKALIREVTKLLGTKRMIVSKELETTLAGLRKLSLFNV